MPLQNQPGTQAYAQTSANPSIGSAASRQFGGGGSSGGRQTRNWFSQNPNQNQFSDDTGLFGRGANTGQQGLFQGAGRSWDPGGQISDGGGQQMSRSEQTRQSPAAQAANQAAQMRASQPRPQPMRPIPAPAVRPRRMRRMQQSMTAPVRDLETLPNQPGIRDTDRLLPEPTQQVGAEAPGDPGYLYYPGRSPSPVRDMETLPTQSPPTPVPPISPDPSYFYQTRPGVLPHSTPLSGHGRITTYPTFDQSGKVVSFSSRRPSPGMRSVWNPATRTMSEVSITNPSQSRVLWSKGARQP